MEKGHAIEYARGIIPEFGIESERELLEKIASPKRQYEPDNVVSDLNRVLLHGYHKMGKLTPNDLTELAKSWPRRTGPQWYFEQETLPYVTDTLPYVLSVMGLLEKDGRSNWFLTDRAYDFLRKKKLMD